MTIATAVFILVAVAFLAGSWLGFLAAALCAAAARGDR